MHGSENEKDCLKEKNRVDREISGRTNQLRKRCMRLTSESQAKMRAAAVPSISLDDVRHLQTKIAPPSADCIHSLEEGFDPVQT